MLTEIIVPLMGKKRKQPGRPPMGKDARTDLIGVRFKKPEAQAIRAAAKKAGISPAEYIRRKLLGD